MSKKNTAWALAIALAYELIAAVLLGIYVGDWLDNSKGWKPWGSVVGISVPFVAVLISAVIKFSRAQSKED